MTMQFEKEKPYCFDQAFFQQQVQRNYKNALKQFKTITQSFSLFKISFFLLFVVEVVFLLLYLAFSPFSSWIAIFLGGLFLTVFSFSVLLFYFQSKKAEQMVLLRDRFIQSCKQAIPLPEEVPEHHLLIAQSALHLVTYLRDFEYSYYAPPKKLEFLTSRLEKMSYFLHKEDVFRMKELLLLAAIGEHVNQMRLTPTDLEVHGSLAHGYICLSKVYQNAQEERNANGRPLDPLLQRKFEAAVKKAIEEFSILKDYAPNDPWVHSQLAKGFESLGRMEEEAHEYEAILELSPSDYEILFRLGVLYFKLGYNAKGLRIYEELKKIPHKKAEELISYYGATIASQLASEE